MNPIIPASHRAKLGYFSSHITTIPSYTSPTFSIQSPKNITMSNVHETTDFASIMV